MSNLDYDDIREIADTLFDHYYSIGVRDGAEAITNLIDDYTSGLLSPNLLEWGVVTEAGEFDLMKFQGEIFWTFVKMVVDYKPLQEPANWLRPGVYSPAAGDGTGLSPATAGSFAAAASKTFDGGGKLADRHRAGIFRRFLRKLISRIPGL